jgi:thioredoxin reductase (NADPH)
MNTMVMTGGDVAAAGRWKEGGDPYLIETGAPGAFACRDIGFSPVKRIASAVGEGGIAIAFAHQSLPTGPSA